LEWVERGEAPQQRSKFKKLYMGEISKRVTTPRVWTIALFRLFLFSYILSSVKNDVEASISLQGGGEVRHER
jgi:hypothetical protein